MKTSIYLIAVILILSGCSSTNLITMSVLEPAPVSLPAHMKKIGTVNRSLPTEESKKMDKLDKILTLEISDMDGACWPKCIEGLTDELKKNDRFTEVKYLDKANLKSTASGTMPSPLSWDEVEKVCKDGNFDGLFVLELFDTDSKIGYEARPVTIKGPLGVEVPGIEHHSSINTEIKTGWRIYDKVNKVIIDEYNMPDRVLSEGKGINPAAAAQAVTGQKDRVKGRCIEMGKQYAQSILPYYITVYRDYYVRGCDNFKIAKRKAQTQNWDGAAELWKTETDNPKAKIAGRACYNMAIKAEIDGDLDGAIKWACKAYENYDNKLAIRYVNVLKYRKEQNSRLKNQQEDAQ
ncbi:MAG: hypothetical protein A2W91_08085 [Bacteroidetes bacterium GWF2_38_335]|nr:MAG: hypothetical protein A2W91_08085 [Bacteroidetes bacterium GWF2_38_335]OFY78996.1 MAG: hypothetical protein A2281_02635 [Bacteroidetes bacterium RIFOXYA12_FULL_38_20]HBS86068.1 hypothetical protein [Bacteroidales bacterium]